MAQQQQTVLRVQTNRTEILLPSGYTSVATGTTMTLSGSGTTTNPYTGTTVGGNTEAYIDINQNGGTIYYMISGQTYSTGSTWNDSRISLIRDNTTYLARNTNIYNAVIFGELNVLPGDQIYTLIRGTNSKLLYLYFIENSGTTYTYENKILDTYSDIPIKLNKSFAELQDISKRNSDFSIGLSLPGSKTNNGFFESFFNVDVDTLYFNPLLRVPAMVLINDEVYFDGYLKLNKINVLNSKVEYDVTLFSNIGDLFGKIGNNLLKDLNFADPTNLFNHNFSATNVVASWNDVGFAYENPKPYIYPIVHNGYEYSGNTVNLSGNTIPMMTGETRLYTTSTPISGYSSNAAMLSAGVVPYRINTPLTGILDNQLKPALNIYQLMQLIFNTYGYTIKSDFMNTPWMKGLYMYGYFNNDTTKFSYKTNPVNTTTGTTQAVKLVETHVDVISGTCANIVTTRTYTISVVDALYGTGQTANQPYSICLDFCLFPCSGGAYPYAVNLLIPAGSTGTTYSWISNAVVPCPVSCLLEYTQNYGLNPNNSNIAEFNVRNNPQTVFINDGSYVDFSKIIDINLKQIDILSSIAKKFNLVFVPDPDVANQIIIEPYQYYIGTGVIKDWTNKISFDKGFSVEPALNYIESELILTDLDDGDDGNKQFKDRNNRIYGQNYIFNQTDFKSTTKKIETIFSPQLTRKWDDNVGVPLGINYVSSNSPEKEGGTEKVKWTYKGIKTKPKLFYYLGNFNAFLDTLGEAFNDNFTYNTYEFYLMTSDGTGQITLGEVPVISNTMPLGNPDFNKINNDSICILFNSEQPADVGVDTYENINAYTDQDMYNLFYENRINNLYNQNTRFLSGYLDLKLSDIKNLNPKDLIKINEQYFTWNKIEGFNMTNPELTKVELIQVDNNPSTYPTRYFQYYYCADSATKYNISTDFTNPNMLLTHFYISNWYDYNIGILGGNVTGLTSSFRVTTNTYLPFRIYEITQQEFDTTGSPYTADPNIDFDDLTDVNYVFSNSYWSSTNYTGINLWNSCADFTSTATSYGITVASPSGGTPSSIYHSGITLNITDTGWLKYDTVSGTTYQNVTSLGTYVIPDCADCSTIREGIPLADLAAWTITNCGNSC